MAAFADGAYGWAIAGAVGFVLGVMMAQGAQKQFVVKLTSSSGEIEALRSNDESSIDEVVTALNKAIIARG